MPFALFFTFLFAFCGLCIARFVCSEMRLVRQIWFGLVFGLLLLTWLPSLFAFVVGFTRTAQFLAVIVALLLAATSLFLLAKKKSLLSIPRFIKGDLSFLWIVGPLFVIGAFLFHTHILCPRADGTLSVGQVTYGDLAMHLGFITSIAAQGTFPPEYSIFPGHLINYPFLCETSASSLAVLGASTRAAYLITALYAYLLVLLGVWFFMKTWLKTNRRAGIATLLFFVGGGFGFAYFFDLAKGGTALGSLLNDTYSSSLSRLLDGFYNTPTNLPAIGLRWVNPIVDMLVPQRATLFGWAFLFPCLSLLLEFHFHGKTKNVFLLGFIAGLLPLIHTHSFLALGILSAVYCLSDLAQKPPKKKILFWAIYALFACVLAAPQLFGFTFRQVSEGSMLKLHWNWANSADSYLWFYIKNFGWLFLLLPIAFFTLSRRDRKIYLAPLLLWVLAEIVIFQPNTYDNNKLLFIWYVFTCALVAKFLDNVYRRLLSSIRRRSTSSQRILYTIAVSLILTLFVLISLAIVFKNDGRILWYTCFTLLFLIGLSIYLLFRSIFEAKYLFAHIFGYLAVGAHVVIAVMLLRTLYQSYQSTEFYIPSGISILMIALCALALLLHVALLFEPGLFQKLHFSYAPSIVALHGCTYLLAITLTLSSLMTILRECKSEYQTYTPNDLAVVEYIREYTAPDSLFLANSYHWNLVTPLTGRSIVTGTATFLYFHGIDNSTREADVRQMYEHPEESMDLFRQYGVDYILISNAERMTYTIDYDAIEKNCPLVFRNSSAEIYKVIG